MDQILIYSLLSALFLLLASKLTRSRHKSLPPSPFALPVLGHLHLLKEPLHRTLSNLSQKYGPIFSLRVGFRLLVVVSSPSAVQECFTKNDIVLANRPRFVMGKYVGYDYTTLGLAPYGDHWRNLRRLATIEIFSSNRLNMSLDIRADEVNRLLRRLFQVSANGFAKVELKSLFSELTFNIIMRMIAGKRYFGDDVSGNYEEGRRFREIIKERFELAVSSYPGDFVPILQLVDYNGYISRITRLGNKADELMQGMIDEHRRNKGDLKIKNTMITHLLSLQESQPDYYTDEIIKGLVQVILNAGTDTTAVTLEWAMSNLLNYPHVLEKARVELAQNVAAPFLVPHLASDNCSIGGYEIPKEAILLVNAWTIQRDPILWEDPTTFKPERFESKETSDQTYRLMPFGLGRRACPGMGLAHHVLGLTLGSLIQCFEWKRVSEKKIDMTEERGLTMPKVEPLEALCKASHIADKVLSIF
ncbi:Cytochrome P450, family 81, subfamily H, polypeptide 1, putative [Theobroma cacao]|uniref:Cytochrome P450, family 81, subfamily H, polypeptide 1, putative n=1 Tax=Theobroma cacao TaxID=3641 RepID=A0A061DGU7_THECC|nr:Cytochrome P450, family 81, subfamily H, polypeptide 1, putative [Theobroma cacao]